MTLSTTRSYTGHVRDHGYKQFNLIQQLHLSQKTMPLNVNSVSFAPIDILSVPIDILINAHSPKQVNSHSKTSFIQ